MKAYFVRHGQSIFNQEERHQFPDTPLSDTGLMQAKAIASRFTNIPLELIVASPFTRALQTAQAIEKIKSVPLIQNSLLVERKLPTAYRGQLHSDPELQKIRTIINEHIDDPLWHFSDEENFADLHLRAKSALKLISSQKEQSIAVVTHGYFLTLMITCILFDENLTAQLFKSFRSHITYANTGLTMCEYVEGKWRLLTWNDYAHLGD